MAAPSFDQLVEDFDFLDDWEDRYRYVIELGRDLPAFDEAGRTADNKVQGCVSQVWITSRTISGDDGTKCLAFDGDSDALIVKGLIAILRILLNNQPAARVAAMDVQAELSKLGLNDHLTPQRSNGLAAMIARLKSDASSDLVA